jgi:predicted nuclease with TOPRIM domain
MQDRLFDLADELKALRDRKAALEAELKQLNVDIDNVDWHLSELMAETETQNFTRSGTMFCLTTKTRASATAGKKDELFAALRAEGFGDLIYETVNANSLSAFVKEQIAENTESLGGAEHPEGSDALPAWLNGLVSVFEKTMVSVRNAR